MSRTFRNPLVGSPHSASKQSYCGFLGLSVLVLFAMASMLRSQSVESTKRIDESPSEISSKAQKLSAEYKPVVNGFMEAYAAKNWPDVVDSGERLVLLDQKLRIPVAERLETLERLAEAYIAVRNFEQALSSYSKALRLVDNAGDENDWRATSLGYHIKYVELIKNKPEKLIAAANALEQQIFTAFDRADYPKCIELVGKLKAVEVRLFGTEHPFFANTLAAEVECFLKSNRHEDALRSAKQAFEIRKTALGTTHPETARAAVLVATANTELGNSKVAKEFLGIASKGFRDAGELLNAIRVDLDRVENLSRSDDENQAIKDLLKQLLADCEKTHAPEEEAKVATALATVDSDFEANTLRQRLWDEARQAARKREVEQALRLTQRVSALDQVIEEEQFANLSTSLEFTARLYEALRRWVPAAEAWHKRLQLFSQRYGNADYRTTNARLEIERVLLRIELTSEQLALLQEGGRLTLQADMMARFDNLESAISAAKKAIELRKQALGETHIYIAAGYSQLASLFEKSGKLNEAEAAYREALRIRKKLLGKNHPAVATSLTNFGVFLYKFRTDFEQAELLLKQSIDVCAVTTKNSDTDWISAKNNLAGLYRDTSRFREAAKIYRECLNLFEERGEKNTSKYVSTTANLATLLMKTGDLGEAATLIEGSLDLIETKDPSYVTALNNLAVAYRRMGLTEKAISAYERCLELINTRGSDERRYLRTLLNLAAAHSQQKNYQEALKYYEKHEIRSKKAGNVDPLEAWSTLSNRAMLHVSLGDFERAYGLLDQALESSHSISRINSSALAILHHNRFRLYVLDGKTEQAVVEATKAQKHLKTAITDALTTLSERQQIELGKQYQHYFDNWLSFEIDHPGSLPWIAEAALRKKGASLVRQRRLRMVSQDEEMSRLFVELQAVSRKLSIISRALRTRNDDELSKELRLLQIRKEKIEADLIAQNQDFKFLANGVNISNVQAAIPDGTILVDIHHYLHRRPSERQGEWIAEWSYAALIIPAGDSKPRLIRVGKAGLIDSCIDLWRHDFGVGQVARANAKKLRNLLWRPIEATLGHEPSIRFKSIYISPDAMLAKLPFAALPGRDEGRFLIEEYGIDYLSMPRMLLMLQQPDLPASGRRKRKPSIMLVGNVDYSRRGADDGDKQVRSRLQANDNHYTFDPIPGTTREINSIESLCRQTLETGVAIEKLGGQRATEARFYELAGKSQIVHLATHGFFLDRSSSLESQYENTDFSWDVDTSNSTLSSVCGIGASLKRKSGKVVIDKIVEGGAADRDGKLMVGDIIIAVANDGEESIPLLGAVSKAISLIRGELGTRVHLEILRPQAEEGMTVVLRRDLIINSDQDRLSLERRKTAFRVSMIGDSPELLSGVAFAGANLAPEGNDDGILTAMEIASTPLSDVDMVVLSACETGLGRTTTGEGLVGVQRAFQVTGVRTTISSLWKVDDRMTEELMTEFYRNLLVKNMSKSESLRQAQLTFIRASRSVERDSKERARLVGIMQEVFERASLGIPQTEDSLRRLREGESVELSPYFWAPFALYGDRGELPTFSDIARKAKVEKRNLLKAK